QALRKSMAVQTETGSPRLFSFNSLPCTEMVVGIPGASIASSDDSLAVQCRPGRTRVDSVLRIVDKLPSLILRWQLLATATCVVLKFLGKANIGAIEALTDLGKCLLNVGR